ncbi:Sulfurtransferase TusA [Planctomycetes bacterium Poly30]|uniref:Sulfurtransferase TusA n=1 Tax=Saltatorellus ferox TaxID=2528018 RepID=A0A518EMY1_9BACT|nr:Sulfurtransferase TusA [Planctomycetes bacterium Poly30]
MVDHLDCRGLQCPMPIVQLSLRVRDLAPGDLLTVEATDPAFRADISAWSEMTGHRLVSFEESECLTATIEVKA